MAASKGRSFLLQIGDGATSEEFSNVGGLRSTEIQINNEIVDVTTKDSAGIRYLLDGAGIRSVSVSGSGVFQDDTYGKLFRTKALAGAQWNFRIIDSDTGDYFTGTFAITNFSQAGEHQDAMTYSGTIESSGAVTFTEV